MLLLEANPRDGHVTLRMPAALGLPLENIRINLCFKSEPEPGLGVRISDAAPYGATIWVRTARQSG